MARWQLSGRLDLSTVPDLWPQLAARIHESKRLVVSLEEVKSASSAALALLLQGLEEAQNSGCVLRYEKIPPQLQALARVSNVQDLLL